MCLLITYVCFVHLQVVTRGVHEYILQAIVAGAPTLAVGGVGHLRTLETLLEQRSTGPDLFKYRMQLFHPADVRPFHRASRQMLIISKTPVTFHVCNVSSVCIPLKYLNLI